jgi:hypothetical protein
MTIYWAPFLHAYQPPWQEVNVLLQIYEECYKTLLQMMERHENIKITLNIQGGLLNQIAELNVEEAHLTTQKLIRTNKVELVGSAKYHPILPLIPKEEIHRQIHLNEVTLKNFFPQAYLHGFFPPEMAVSPEICESVKNAGYSWMLMDGIAHRGKWPYNYIQESPSGLKTFFRDTLISNKISFQSIDAQGFVNQLLHMDQYFKKQSKKDDEPYKDCYVITAQDAETFGHHIPYYETSFLGKVFSLIEDRPEIEICYISDLINYFPSKPSPPIKSSSWSTSAEDLEMGIPYPLWQHPLNPVHKFQNRMLKPLYHLMDILEQVYARFDQKSPPSSSFLNYYQTARHFYDQALHSCWLWWASMRNMWSPNLIYKGMDLILKSALNAQLALINAKVGRGDELYTRIMDNTTKLMNEVVEQEIRGQKLRTYGDKLDKNTKISPSISKV